MEVYVFETLCASDDDVFIKIYANENDALKEAVQSIIHRLDDYGCNDSTDANYEFYQEVSKLYSEGKYKKALKEYRDWNSELDEYSHVVYYSVYSCEVNGTPKIDNDIPCKQCKRNVSKSDKECWHCGCMEPGDT